MKLDKLQYQLDAIEKVISAIDKNNIAENGDFYANPLLQNTKGIDVKMETGTGKTYVYTRLMHELKRQFGFFKFIIIVPSVAIKEGVKMSIISDEWNKHFRQEFGNQNINFGIINAGDFDVKKGKRKQIPVALSSFCEAARVEEKSVQVLLLNDAMLASTSMTRKDYDSALFGSVNCPIEGLKNTRPIVIIDEPHRFSKENKAWKNITEGLNPQLIIRFGATFPDKGIGAGKNKTTEKDYENLVYDLNSVRAFNENLVKGVHIRYPKIPNVADDGNILKCKVISINKDGNKLRSVTFSCNNRKIEVEIGGAMSSVDTNFNNIVLDLDGKNLVLSNGTSIEIGMSILPQIFSMNYQEVLLKQAIDIHFEKEKENFFRPNNAAKIKTNSLFFIDSISSFRGNDENEKGWLRVKFEELLKQKLESEIAKTNDEYRQYLQYSLQNIEDCLAGYFSQDNSDSDKAIQDEVDKVLRNKEQSLKFKNEQGKWNVCRFFFSKWTLCEGWDNPNVFVITKLRSSGSENRKIQEVGRGLRLPFDESGRRISNEDFYLTYIIDYSERDFARKLVGEINADGGKLADGKITDSILDKLVEAKYADNKAKAKGKLLLDDIIDDKDTILDIEKLFTLLPADNKIKLKDGKVIGDDLPKKPMVKLRKENFEKLRSLWKEVTKRYLLRFKALNASELQQVLDATFTDNVFVKPDISIVEEYTAKGDGNVLLYDSGASSVNSNIGTIYYGEFLKRLSKRTSLSVGDLHNSICKTLKDRANPSELFNTISLENIIKNFQAKFEELFAQKYDYSPLDFTANTSLFQPDGTFKDELAQGLLGDKVANDFRDNSKFLYDKAVYDSEIEHEVLKIQPKNEVVVYGKLPKQSIKVPTYTGGTTSPDFVYAICENNSETIKLHLIVETKSDNLRMSDAVAVQAQEKLFKNIPNIEWRMETSVEQFEKDLKSLCE
ncbi:MAG: type III restriction-modification system endonuclease [Prevotellaceae bacterium]|jgi:type III restriction enzyme|nr:type III restriction-modification system endonuclease [Prevotellaceae bacterium]